MARTARIGPRRPRSLIRSAIDLGIFLVLLGLVVAGLRLSGLLSIEAGPVKVLDGDSLRRGETEIRLYGIDAPEYTQTCRDADGHDWACGRAAARALRELIGGGDVDCTIRDQDRYGRVVALCRAGSIALNERMLRDGWAVSYRHHEPGFIAAESDARAASRGIWQGTFELPQEWRARHRDMQSVSGEMILED